MSRHSLFMGKTNERWQDIFGLEVISVDLIKIGKFIAELRKEHGWTQEQLGEKLGVTNKTVSRWETGTYLPPADILLAMSELYSLSVNELLSGRRLNDQEYRREAEKNLTEAIATNSFSLKERIDFYKRKWLKEHIFAMCLWGVVILALFFLGIACKIPLLMSISVFSIVFAHCWRNNSMMAYVEKHAFDGKS